MSKKKAVKRTRRANNEGSIFQRSDGRWGGALTMGYDENGKIIRKTIYGKSRAEVAKKLSEISGRMKSNSYDLVEQNDLETLMFEYLMTFKKSAVSPRTFEGNIRCYNLHIKPYVANMDISEVTAPVIQQVINEVFVKGRGTNTARKTKFLFNQFFEYAIDCGLVENNPTLRIKIKARDTFQHDMENKYKAIPEDVRMKFVIALNQHEFLKPFCMTMMFAGLRAGEALALRWENIDFNNKTITVKNSVTQVPIFDKKGKVLSRKTVIGQTKTNCSVREVPIPDILIDVLKDWRKCQWVRKELSGVDLLAPNAVVFANSDGSVRSYAGTRHVFDRFAKRNGFYGKIHFHTLRHTYSTMLFEANENPKVIQALLGHKSVKTTLTVYNSVDKSYYRQATDKLNNLFNSDKMKEYKELENKKDIPVLNREIDKDEEDYETDEEIELLEKLLAQKKARKRDKDFEM